MNAQVKFDPATATVDQAAIAPFPNSTKVYIDGSRPGIRVPMRSVSQSASGGEDNPPIFLYDTSGPYTDPAAAIDIRRGLDTPRAPWIDARGDT